MCNVCVGVDACMCMYNVLVGVNVSVIMCSLVWMRVCVCVAPPIVVGTWPMAGTLWRLIEYYQILPLSYIGLSLSRTVNWTILLVQSIHFWFNCLKPHQRKLRIKA